MANNITAQSEYTKTTKSDKILSDAYAYLWEYINLSHGNRGH